MRRIGCKQRFDHLRVEFLPARAVRIECRQGNDGPKTHSGWRLKVGCLRPKGCGQFRAVLPQGLAGQQDFRGVVRVQQPLGQRGAHGFRLAQTVWETLPLMGAYRNRHARRYRELVLAETDLFLPATERAAATLRLEGVPDARIRLCPPGIDTDRFAVPAPDPHPEAHTIVSPGRLVWEKGHHDVLRALAALHRGIVTLANGEVVKPRLLLVGAGPEEGRLREHAAELGLGDAVAIGGVPYERMPAVFAGASAMVLASQSSAGAAYHPFDIPHAFWEEQFGFVLIEALAAGLAIVTTTNGAIPEVLAGVPAALVAPGDWLGIARALAAGPLSRPPATRVPAPAEVLARYSTGAAAQRLAAAYDRLLDAS